MDLGKNNVPPENFPYELDEEGQIVDSESPAGIRLRYERLRKRVVPERWTDAGGTRGAEGGGEGASGGGGQAVCEHAGEKGEGR